MPEYWNDPKPAGWPLNQPKTEGKSHIFHQNKESSNAFWRDTEMPLKPSGWYSAQGIKRLSVDEQEL